MRYLRVRKGHFGVGARGGSPQMDELLRHVVSMKNSRVNSVLRAKPKARYIAIPFGEESGAPNNFRHVTQIPDGADLNYAPSRATPVLNPSPNGIAL